tara:strand:- start:165 stop:398 length:234 start_codon:yes stop_codon:yes gene_type:complete
MLIGTIVDISNSNDPGNASYNGTSSVIFYTYKDAVVWCELMSQGATYNTANLLTATMFIDTDTEIRRWWYGGVEYTG